MKVRKFGIGRDRSRLGRGVVMSCMRDGSWFLSPRAGEEGLWMPKKWGQVGLGGKTRMWCEELVGLGCLVVDHICSVCYGLNINFHPWVSNTIPKRTSQYTLIVEYQLNHCCGDMHEDAHHAADCVALHHLKVTVVNIHDAGGAMLQASASVMNRAYQQPLHQHATIFHPRKLSFQILFTPPSHFPPMLLTSNNINQVSKNHCCFSPLQQGLPGLSHVVFPCPFQIHWQSQISKMYIQISLGRAIGSHCQVGVAL